MRTTLTTILAALLAAACGGGSGSNDGDGSKPLSIVVLGDSIASGEGLNYGYSYSTDFPNKWIGGTDNPTWQGDHPLCHDSAEAYGDVLAASLGATLSKFACTGSTYDNGISFDRRAGGVAFRPAQFGNWLGMTNLNADYDAAKPDVVIVTLGADDVSFLDVFTFCATGYTDADEVAALAQLADPTQRLRENFRQRFPTTGAWLQRPRRNLGGGLGSSYCTAANPGAPIQSLFWDRINSGEIAGHYKSLVAAIRARGALAGKIPRIIFTTYHQPLPAPSQSDECLDLGDLGRDEIDDLITLEATLSNTIIGAVSGLDGVAVADIGKVVKGHEWCTNDPWSYGLSVLFLDTSSNAPFHPVPQAQAALAAVIHQVLQAP